MASRFVSFRCPQDLYDEIEVTLLTHAQRTHSGLLSTVTHWLTQACRNYVALLNSYCRLPKKGGDTPSKKKSRSAGQSAPTTPTADRSHSSSRRRGKSTTPVRRATRRKKQSVK